MPAVGFVFHVTDESNTIKNKYRTLANTYINYAFTSGRCTNGSNILRDEGHSGDQSIFKAVLIPYAVNFVLDEDMNTTNRLNIYKYIQKNTSTMWKNLDISNYPIVFYNFIWTSPYVEEPDVKASMGAACSGASLIENMARMNRAITDRYDLGTLYTECSKLSIEPGFESDPIFVTFSNDMQTASEIMASPGNYSSYQFRQAIEKLQTSYQAAQDYATGIATIHDSKSKIQNDDAPIYDLSGRMVNGKWEGSNLPRGIYIKGGRKVFVK